MRIASLKIEVFARRTQHGWALWNQGVAVSAATLMLFLLLVSVDDNRIIRLPLLVLVSLAGGMVAPFAKDIVVALSGLRTRRLGPSLPGED